MRILLDTNVVLDVLLKRDPWQADASAIWLAIDGGSITAYLTASSVTDIFYVARRLTDIVRARQSVQVCLEGTTIAIWSPADCLKQLRAGRRSRRS